MAEVVFDHVTRIYPGNDKPSVDDLNLDIKDGEFLVLVGPSGCGKSTTLRMLAGLEEVNKGRILIGGKDVTTMQPKDRDIAMVFQNYALYPHMTVADNMGFALKIAGTPKEEIRKRVEKAAEILDLTEYLDRKPKALSGGQRQRVGIARALAVNPEFIVCDEPVSALDVSIQAQVVNMFEDLQQEMGLTYLFIAHDLSVVKHISNRIGVMYLGKLVELADSYELIAHSIHPYTRSLISAIPVADPITARQSKRIVLQGDVPSPLNPPSGCRFRTRCPYADERCAAEVPEFKEVTSGHWAACHHLDKVK